VYVLFETQTREIRSAAQGPFDDPPADFTVGEVPDGTCFDGALKNYVFVEDESQAASETPRRGRVQRKPEAEWDRAAEELELHHRSVSQRFHHLDMEDVRLIDVHLMLPSRFEKLREATVVCPVLADGVQLDVSLSRRDPIPLDVQFSFGGYTIPFHRTAVAFHLTGREPFLTSALQRHLASLPEDGRRLFTSHYLQRESLLYGVRVANRLIDSYRVAFHDPSERPVGLADVLAGAMVVELTDGERCSFYSGISLRHLPPDERGRTPEAVDGTAMNERFRQLALKEAVPFFDVSVMDMRKAHLYGQYRDCVVWAGTIIGNVIEDILLQRLDKNSPEYKKLKTRGRDVSGETRRGDYFKKATGKTLREWLEEIGQKYGTPDLAQRVEDVLNNRNLLLHRRKAIRPEEADVAYKTCMEFLTGLFSGVPFVPQDEMESLL